MPPLNNSRHAGLPAGQRVLARRTTLGAVGSSAAMAKANPQTALAFGGGRQVDFAGLILDKGGRAFRGQLAFHRCVP